ncbi:YdcH family protein, partial [Acidihalobacter prosperus]
MDKDNNSELEARILALKIEHRDLDAAISAMTLAPGIDQLQLSRLKRRKLQLKDTIARLESNLIPDM